MANKTILYVSLAVGLLLLLSGNSAAAAVQPGMLNINSLVGYNQYATQDSVDILNNIYQELQSRGYTNLQILFMLSQILHETGLFTSVANWKRINNNNFAGLTLEKGGYAAYPDISSFVDAYNGFLTKKSNPLGASDLNDFNNRLQQNGYYTADPQIYLNDLQKYYNLLSNTIGQ